MTGPLAHWDGCCLKQLCTSNSPCSLHMERVIWAVKTGKHSNICLLPWQDETPDKSRACSSSGSLQVKELGEITARGALCCWTPSTLSSPLFAQQSFKSRWLKTLTPSNIFTWILTPHCCSVLLCIETFRESHHNNKGFTLKQSALLPSVYLPFTA